MANLAGRTSSGALGFHDGWGVAWGPASRTWVWTGAHGLCSDRTLLPSSGGMDARGGSACPLLAGGVDTQALGPCPQDPWLLTSLVQDGVRGAGPTVPLSDARSRVWPGAGPRGR